MARVDAVVHYDARIAPQLVGDLTLADIHRMNACRAALQQTVRKSARRSAEVHAHRAGRVNFEMIERRLQLVSAAADKLLLRLQFDGGIGRDLRAGLVRDLSRHQNLSGHDGAFGLLAALAQPAFHQQQIQPQLFHVVTVTAPAGDSTRKPKFAVERTFLSVEPWFSGSTQDGESVQPRPPLMASPASTRPREWGRHHISPRQRF